MLAREEAARLPPARARQLLAGGAEVLAIDPGDYGAAARRRNGVMPQVVDFRTLDDWDMVADMVDFSRPLVVLLEDQFGGKSFGSSKETIWTSGVLTGYLFAHRPPACTVVHVAPSTWQAAQRRRMGVYGVQLDREAGIGLALHELLTDAPTAHGSVNKAKREGFASALGILLWWEGLVSQCKG
jgi:hypothetical protein